MTSQPSMGAVCSALEQTNLGTGISHENIQALNLYWSSVRTLYSCFDANVKRWVLTFESRSFSADTSPNSSDSGVFDHEMPGGQYTNLMFVVPPFGRRERLLMNCSPSQVPVAAARSFWPVEGSRQGLH